MDLETRHLRQLLSEAQQLPEVLLLKKTTTSTNDEVKEIAQKGIQSILVCSEMQTHGRGQHQREWVSPVGNIYLSALLETRIPLDGRISLEVALNLLQIPSLKNLSNLKIKWPNDLYSDFGKWGGILVEPLDSHKAVVGIGINLMPVTHKNIDQPTTSLMQLGLNHPNRIQIISEMYLAIQQAGQWFEHGSYNLAGRFNHHAAFLNEEVEFEQVDQTISGLFKGISDDGAISIQTANELGQFYQGRLRLKAN